MPEALQLARPAEGTAASFHADRVRRPIDNERGRLATLELLLQDGLAAFFDCIDLKRVICQVNANRRQLHDEPPARLKWLNGCVCFGT